MAFTAVTVNGTAARPDGTPIPNAEVTFSLDQDMVNGGTHASGAQTHSAADGTFSIVVDATDDAGTTTVDGIGEPYYDVKIVDPSSNESITEFRAPVPSATTPTTIAALQELAV